MKRLTAIVMMLLCVATARAEESALPVPILPLFKAGDKIRYEVTHQKTDSITGPQGKFRWQFTLEVLAFKGDRLELRYTCHDRTYEVDGKQPMTVGPGMMVAGSPPELKVLAAITNVPLDFVVSMDTLAVEMPKYDDARARVSRVLSAVADADPAFLGEPLVKKRFLENMERMYTKQVVLAFLTRDFLPLLRPYGQEIEPGKATETKLPMSSPFGGAVLADAKGKLTLTPGKDKRVHQLQYDMTFDSAAVKSLLADMVMRNSGKSLNEISDQLDKIDMSIGAKSTFQYDSQSGWMTHSEQTLTWTMDKRTASETRSWIPAPPPAPEKTPAKEKGKDK